MPPVPEEELRGLSAAMPAGDDVLVRPPWGPETERAIAEFLPGVVRK